MCSSLTKRNGWAAGALLVASVAVSCTVFDDVVVTGVASGSAGGAAAAAGGAHPDGGAGGAPSGGAAGAGGAEPKVGYLSMTQAATLCARVFACDQVGESIRASTGLPIGRASFSHCMTWLAGPLPSNRQPTPGQVEMLEAMVEAADCDKTRKAAWVEKLDDADSLCDGHDNRRCAPGGGAAVIDCTARKLIERCDNALLGADTICTGNKGAIGCATGTCSIAELGGHCVGNAIAYCLGALDEIAGCTERGLICNPPTLDCRDDAAVKQDCDLAGNNRCDGAVVKVCTEGIGTTGEKVESPFDCAKVGAGAMCKSGPAIHCAPPTPACSLMDPDECIDGEHIRLCVGGERRELDCGGIAMQCLPADAAAARCGIPAVP